MIDGTKIVDAFTRFALMAAAAALLLFGLGVLVGWGLIA